MKGFKIGLIIALSVLALGMTVVLVMAVSGRDGFGWHEGDFGDIMENCTLRNTQEIDVTEVSELNLDYSGTCYDITIYSTDDDKMVLEEYFNYDAQFAEVSTDGTKLKIRNEMESWNRTGFSFGEDEYFWNNRRGYIKLYVPKELFGRLERLAIASSSGDVEADFLQAKEVAITANSGDVELISCEGNATIDTTSGNIELEYANGNLKLSSNSGDKEIGNCTGNLETISTSGETFVETCGGTLEANANSGDVTIKNLSAGATVETSSGEISIDVTKLSGDISVSGSSGGAVLRLPADSTFSFEANTSSGDIRTWFDDELSYNNRGNEAKGKVGANPVYSIRCSFTSGDVDVKTQ